MPRSTAPPKPKWNEALRHAYAKPILGSRRGQRRSSLLTCPPISPSAPPPSSGTRRRQGRRPCASHQGKAKNALQFFRSLPETARQFHRPGRRLNLTCGRGAGASPPNASGKLCPTIAYYVNFGMSAIAGAASLRRPGAPAPPSHSVHGIRAQRGAHVGTLMAWQVLYVFTHDSIGLEAKTVRPASR